MASSGPASDNAGHRPITAAQPFRRGDPWRPRGDVGTGAGTVSQVTTPSIITKFRASRAGKRQATPLACINPHQHTSHNGSKSNPCSQSNPTSSQSTHTHRQSKQTGKKKPIPWDRDGVNGGDSSMDILLNWITLDNNYLRWQGNTEHRKTKKSLCSEILEILKDNGIFHRDIKGIMQRINDL
ncbi:hypothetical protein PCASD_11542 [Puccinia coronata f. sp. avenae]|uniref:Uncharacterized protein n=1 Tax=Puccinia coronata f. sp. avenae TaxID=200324 RepID=A0A2N5UM75_9BASI|nr:hypothetical protein PCASD_11542 [Puccinia coronata f. sp. avenae]